MKMKIYHLFFLGFVLLIACGCNKEIPLAVSQAEIKVPFAGNETEISVTTEHAWTASSSADWCKLSKTSANGASYVKIKVETNLLDAREATITIRTNKETKMITIKQDAKEPNVEYVYELPVIFHVLYNNPADPKQNIPYEHITRVLDKANELYAAKNSINGSERMKVEFVLADKDPTGKTLVEKGVHRIRWEQATINAPEFMTKSDKQHMALIWDPNKYINIMLYNFEHKSILGISTFPLVPANHPMAHLKTSPKPILTLADLDKVRCVSINSLYMDQVSEGDKQNLLDVGPTLAHELGHYLGLRHVFSEGGNKLVPCQDTDYCKDTPSYDKQEYDAKVHAIFQRLENDPDFKKNFSFSELLKRTPCFGDVFMSQNIMDYDFCTKNFFSEDQKKIVRHVLTYSPFIPGPKIVDGETRVDNNVRVELPHDISICPESNAVKYGVKQFEVK